MLPGHHEVGTLEAHDPFTVAVGSVEVKRLSRPSDGLFPTPSGGKLYVKMLVDAIYGDQGVDQRHRSHRFLRVPAVNDMLHRLVPQVRNAAIVARPVPVRPLRIEAGEDLEEMRSRAFEPVDESGRDMRTLCHALFNCF